MPKLYKFFSPNCPGCNSLSMLLPTLLKGTELDVIDVNVYTASESVLQNFGVTSVPALSYKKADGTYNTLVGFRGPVKTKEFLDQLLGELS